jgi:hypothetical protein
MDGMVISGIVIVGNVGIEIVGIVGKEKEVGSVVTVQWQER